MSFHSDFDSLPTVQGISAIDLSQDGAPCGRIENRPGQAGSLRIYLAVARDGRIDAEAARRALALYGDHSEDARARPGTHPNIDRLLWLVEVGATLELQVRPLP